MCCAVAWRARAPRGLVALTLGLLGFPGVLSVLQLLVDLFDRPPMVVGHLASMAAVFRLPHVRAAADILGAAYALPAHLPERGIRVLGVLVARRRHVLTPLLVRRSL